MSDHPFHIVDVFPETRYSGNQLAVVGDAGDLPAGEMQLIAREMNFSETTFIVERAPSASGHRVRIFTPQTELPFAGHPTLGTAFVIREEISRDGLDEIVLDLEIGPIRVIIDHETGSDPIYWMRQRPPVFGSTVERDVTAAVLGLDAAYLDPDVDPQVVSTGLPTLVVALDSIEAVRDVEIDDAASSRLGEMEDFPAVFVFTDETVEAASDVHARMFAPVIGIPEDPATGSSNGCLAAYLSRHRYFGDQRVEAIVEQGYEMGRPSRLHLAAEWTGDGDDVDVRVGGRVVPVAEGVLL